MQPGGPKIILMSSVGATHWSPNDGAVAYTAATQVTAAGFPFVVDSANCTILGISVRRATGTVVEYINGQNGVSIGAAANVITIAGAGAAPFLATDTAYRLYLVWQEKAYDAASDAYRSEEIDPLSAQYATVSLVANEAIAANGALYAPSSAGQAWGGYGPLSIGLYILGGTTAAPADATVEVTIEATNGQTVGGAVVWVDITESFKSLLTALDSVAVYTATGKVTPYHDILTLRREDSNFTHFRVRYEWDVAPAGAGNLGVIVAMARGAAL